MIKTLICVLFIPLAWAGSYVVTFPNSLLPGVDLDVRVHVLQASRDVNVVAYLQHVVNDSIISSASTIVTKGTPSTVRIPVPEGLQTSQYKVNVSGNGGAVFSNVSTIRYEKNNLFMFIQTDKTRYSGGQEVKYRAVLFHPNLLGYKGSVVIKIYDGKGNQIEATEHPTTNDGVLSGRLVLSREPVFGKWKIEVKSALKTVSKSFEVNDYAVPKFSVTVSLSDNIQMTSATFEVMVKARFTFNADVYGRCVIQIYNKPTTYQYMEYSQMIVGKANFTILMADIRSKLSFYEKIIVRALVTDNATTLTMVAETELLFTSDRYVNAYQEQITILKLDQRETFIPGLTYHTPIFIGRGEKPLNTTGSIRVKHTFTVVEEKDCLLNYPPYKWLEQLSVTIDDLIIPFDESGYALLNVPTQPHSDIIELELSYVNTLARYTMYAVSSYSVMMIASRVDKVNGNVGEKVVIVTEATALLTGMVIYEMYSRGILLGTHTDQVYISHNSTFDLELTPDMVPQVYIVVTHVTNMGQLLSDYVAIKVQGSPYKNKVSVHYNTSSLKPGQGVEMVIKADPNSTVYILVEDESNRIIGTENDIFSKEVSGELFESSHNIEENLQISGFYVGRKRNILPLSQPISPSRHMKQRSLIAQEIGIEPFFESGIVILTDSLFFTRRKDHDLLIFNTVLPKKCEPITTTTTTTTTTMNPLGFTFPTWIPGMVPTPQPGVGLGPPDKIPTPAPGSTYPPDYFPTWVPGMPLITTLPPGIKPKEILRTRFPETWMWEEYMTGNDGQFIWTGKVPDSITTWITSVFASNANSGFGISQAKEKITVIKDLFLTVEVPETIIFGEEILVQITVFNYLSTPQQVYLQVVKSDDPSNPIPAASLVKPDKSRSTYVKVTPTQLGELKINVQARAGFSSSAASDSIEKSVFVRPGGVYKSINHQRLVSLKSGGLPFTDTLMFTDPPGIVHGTKSIRLRITGDLMTPSITGLQHLINMPVGCGEQTMVNVAPDAFIMKYLNVTGQLTKTRAIMEQSFITAGYQNMLGRRRTNGSFSIWGEGDTNGSTWLTAYVVKGFHEAKDFVAIDDAVLSTAIDWLLKMQHTDGSFLEGQNVYYIDHNNTDTIVKLTAFTLLTLLEVQNGPTYVTANAVHSVINKGMPFLESKLPTISEAYTLSMVCYVLAQSNNTYGNSCLAKLEACKHSDGDMVFWTESANVVRRSDPFNRKENTTRARDIETTAYALLTYMALGYHSQALPIVQWLVSQRNANGGFQSTQDSVIAIQALTEYASAQNQSTTNYGLQVNAFGIGFMHTYSISQNNYQVIGEVEIPTNLSNIFMQAGGQGNAVIDVIQSFYVSSNASGRHISVMASIEYESLNSLTVNSTVSWTGLKPSHMIMVEVEMPTGFVPDNDFFRKQQLIRRHETNGRIVSLYLDGMIPNGKVSVRVKMNRADPVVKTQACHITVYDYYEPTEQAMTIYESGLLKNADICDVCPLCNVCTESSLFSQIGIGK